MRERDRAADLAGSWEWLEFAARLPAKYVPLAQTGADKLIMSGRCLLLGADLFNMATNGGTVTIYDGTSANGSVAAQIGFPADTTVNYRSPGQGVLLEQGCWLSPSSVTVQGCVFVVPLWHGPRTPPGD